MVEIVQDLKFLNEEEVIEHEDLISSMDNIIQDEGMPRCRIANVVCTYKIGVKLNLNKTALLFRDTLPAKYNPKKFAAMIVTGRVSNKLPMTTILIFSTSNVVHTGAKTEFEARLSAWYLVNYLNLFLGVPATISEFEIRNIVSYFRLGHKVNLNQLWEAIGGRAAFQPQLIHSCRIRHKINPEQVLLVFVTGNIVITGPKDRQAVIDNYRNALKLCANFPDVGRHEYRFGSKKRSISVEEMKKNNEMLRSWEILDVDTSKADTSDKTNKRKKKDESDNNGQHKKLKIEIDVESTSSSKKRTRLHTPSEVKKAMREKASDVYSTEMRYGVKDFISL
jgi:TATA-box binding protein (TBP) (component of TFIID and TFIIIB)